jgi:hypothetical protein
LGYLWEAGSCSKWQLRGSFRALVVLVFLVVSGYRLLCFGVVRIEFYSVLNCIVSIEREEILVMMGAKYSFEYGQIRHS